MLGLFARSMFEATRIFPLSGTDRGPGRLPDDTPTRPDRPTSRRQRFQQLHRGEDLFVMPNAWDAGTARILERLGFPALATTSAGLAFAMGVRDSSGCLSRRVVLENARAIMQATGLPVSADLEDGFGPSPEDCARTIREAEASGLCGGAIEDATGDRAAPIHAVDLAVARIRAAVAARSDPAFLITARAENYICGRPDLQDTIRRLQAFEAAGADVVYAPGLRDIETIRRVCASVTVPVNVVVGLTPAPYTLNDLARAGVRRVSTGGSLARAALGEVMRAAAELTGPGTFSYADRAFPDAEASALMRHVPRAAR